MKPKTKYRTQIEEERCNAMKDSFREWDPLEAMIRLLKDIKEENIQHSGYFENQPMTGIFDEQETGRLTE